MMEDHPAGQEGVHPHAAITAVGERVRIARQSLGMTQEALAQHVGVSRITINQIENGRRKQLKPDALRKIAEATKKPEHYFYAVDTSDGDPPQDAFRDIVQQSNMSPQLGIVFLKLLALSRPHQERLGRLIEQLLLWYEAEIVR
jgi:transcriptional regulator with XRE-family HTH domain